jgi:hypothetical protein
MRIFSGRRLSWIEAILGLQELLIPGYEEAWKCVGFSNSSSFVLVFPNYI